MLVEANSIAFNRLLSKKRRCDAIHACISTSSHPEIVIFDNADVFGGIDKKMDNVINEALKLVSKIQGQIIFIKDFKNICSSGETMLRSKVLKDSRRELNVFHSTVY